MKILITGSSGYIGGTLFRRLSGDHDVTGIDIAPAGGVDRTLHIDITNRTELDKFLQAEKGIEVIIHAAALAHRKGSDLSSGKFKKINFEGTKNLIDASNVHLSLKKFIFCSTISVYGESLDKTIYREDDILNPKTPYAVTKRLSEDYIREHARCAFTILRFAPVYGRGFLINIDRRTRINNILFRAGKGEKKLSLLNMMNIVDLALMLLEKNRSGTGGIFNVADAAAYTYNDLLDFQLRSTGIKTILPLPELGLYVIHYLGRLLGNSFIIENTAKLLSDKIYATDKLASLLNFKYRLDDILSAAESSRSRD